MNKQKVYEILKKRIAEEELLPGQWIVERDICDTFGISRTPVREILQKMANEGLLESETGKGYKVRKLSTEDIIAIYKARAAVEGYAARLACVNKSSEFIGTIDSIRKDIEAADLPRDISKVQSQGRNLHDAIMQETGNFLLQEFYEKLRNFTILSNNYTKSRGSKELEGTAKLGHLKLIEALKQNDPEVAEMTMKQHLQDGIRLVLETYISNSSDLF